MYTYTTPAPTRAVREPTSLVGQRTTNPIPWRVCSQRQLPRRRPADRLCPSLPPNHVWAALWRQGRVHGVQLAHRLRAWPPRGRQPRALGQACELLLERLRQGRRTDGRKGDEAYEGKCTHKCEVYLSPKKMKEKERRKDFTWAKAPVHTWEAREYPRRGCSAS